MTLPDFLISDKFGYVHLVGHRIGVIDILHFYQEGETAEMLAARFPSVTLALHHKVIAYYLENQSEVDGYLQSHIEQEAVQRHAAAGRGPTAG